MEPRVRFRLYLLTALILLGSGTLLSQLYKFQIEQRDYHRQRVPGTRNVTIREPGVRGEITDRNGIVLAQNVRKYELVFNLKEIENAWKVQRKEDKEAAKAARAEGLPEDPSPDAAIVKISDIVDQTIIPRLQEHGIECRYSRSALETHHITHGGLIPFTFPVDLDFDQFSRLAEYNLEMPGVYVTARPRREYPYGTLGGHFLGYLKQWEKGDVPEGADKKFDHYLGEDEGIMGVEASLDTELRGPPGKRTLLKDEKGHILGLVDYIRPGEGARVELTIDARIQFLVENVLRRAGRAAAVVMNPTNGEVLAMASLPNYDPNHFIPSISQADYQHYRANLASPFTNRAISAFTPGSIFKLPTAVTGCLHGLSHHRHNCTGSIAYGRNGDVEIRCWLRTGHGTLDFPSAIQRSCNPFFMSMGTKAGAKAMVDGFQLVGLGEPTGIRLPAEAPGIVPGSLWWKTEYRPGESLTPSLVAQLAIGQGDSAATPLQMCALVSSIANGGLYYQPRIVKRAINPDPRIGLVIEDMPILKRNLLREGLTTEHLDIIRTGMWKAANEAGGTARRASLDEVAVAAKTGTAQTVDHGKKSHNAWTVAYAPYEEPRYAVVVIVQNGGSGGAVAGPLVNMILRGLFAQDAGLKLPLHKLGLFEGHFDPIASIEIPEGDLIPLAIDEVGETGEEASGAEAPQSAIKVRPRAIPVPSITPEADPEPAPPRGSSGGEERCTPTRRRR
jgi:penicillin-binding protein 2